MNLLDLEEAVSQIRQGCRGRQPSPFFFIVGAGISVPSVPTAGEITRHCMAVAKKKEKGGTRSNTPPIDAYSHWFSRAFPSREGRRKYLEFLIQNKPITPANLRLAHVLTEGKVSSLVVTLNFDDLLSRALALFGTSHVVCDHSDTVRRIDPRRRVVQIVHVHGIYWFYDCCNLKHEIGHRTTAMDSFLTRVLWDHSPLVIGYSGWEQDVVMHSLRKRLSSPLGHQLYWFCHRRSGCDGLPVWLRSNSDVVFVVPPQAPVWPPKRGRRTRPDGGGFSKMWGSSLALMEPPGPGVPPKWRSLATVPTREPESPPTTMDACQVLDSIIRAFGLSAPWLTREPLDFFAGQLRKALCQEGDHEETDGLYSIHQVIERVERGSSLEKQDRQQRRKEVECQLEGVRDSLRRADYGKVIEYAGAIDIEPLDETQLRQLIDSLLLAAEHLVVQPKIAAYRLAITLGEALERRGGQGSEVVARAMVNMGLAFREAGQLDEAMAAFDKVVKRFAGADGVIGA